MNTSYIDSAGSFIAQIDVDVTNQCNLRCPFCNVDHNLYPKTEFLPYKVFEKIVLLAPYVGRGRLGVSCEFEPFMNRSVISLMESVPSDLRSKLYFTSNMTIPLSDSQIGRLSDLGMDHINISIDSLDPDVFERLRVNGNFRTFRENVERLAASLWARKSPTKLNFITVLNRLNVGEVSKIMKTCYEDFNAHDYEVREINPVDFHSDWLSENATSEIEWIELVEHMRQQQFRSTLRRSTEYQLHYPDRKDGVVMIPGDFNTPPGLLEQPTDRAIKFRPSNQLIHIFIRSDGTLRIKQRGSVARKVDVRFNEISNPLEFLSNWHAKNVADTAIV